MKHIAWSGLCAGLGLALLSGVAGCERSEGPIDEADEMTEWAKARVGIYAPVELSADLSHLSDSQIEMLDPLFRAADIMDRLFWRQAYGDPRALLDRIGDPDVRRFAEINYGPWDRLAGNRPFVPGHGDKPLGANFYPSDMSREEYDAARFEGKDSLYAMIRRDAVGELMAVPYSVYFADELERAADLLREAAALSEHEGFARYLETRADSFISDDYYPSDIAWMEMRGNDIDFVLGPIETYEDRLAGARAAFTAYLLLKDREWSDRLARFAELLPELQDGLPVDEEYRAERPGTDAHIAAYEIIYYAGDSNAGAKTIAINLPNDERVQAEVGTRRLQLKNAMRAKFDEILVPIARELIDDDQQHLVSFDAFFGNVMFHEVAHGLGLNHTIDGDATVREALKEHASALEEGKADILGLYMITELVEQDLLDDASLEAYYVTFMASIFRSVRFGAASAHGRANMVAFNHFDEMGAFERDQRTHRYRVNFDRMRDAMTSLSRDILMIQGDGDYRRAGDLLEGFGRIGAQLEVDLRRLEEAGIPVDVVFEQGPEVLGLR
jgi:hypothetical protein